MALFDRFFPEYPNPDEVRMTLGEHLEELRSRVVRALIGLAVGTGVCFMFVKQIMGLLAMPIMAALDAEGYPTELYYLNPPEALLTELKISLICGFIAAAPYSAMQIWGFVAAGLYAKERRWVRRFAPVSVVLFFTGVAFLLLVVSPLLLQFLVSYRSELPDMRGALPSWLTPEPKYPVSPEDVEVAWPTSRPASEGAAREGYALPKFLTFESDPADPPEGVPWVNLERRQLRIRYGKEIYTLGRLAPVRSATRLTPNIRIMEYLTFILHLSAAFGIGFQVPVVVAFLAVTGISTAAEMGRLRRYVWFAMAIASAVITPPDVASMLLLLVPMAMLFELGLIVARMIERNRAEAP